MMQYKDSFMVKEHKMTLEEKYKQAIQDYKDGLISPEELATIQEEVKLHLQGQTSKQLNG